MTRSEPYIVRRLSHDLYIAPAEFRPTTLEETGGLRLQIGRGETVSTGEYELTFHRFEFDADHTMGMGENIAWMVLQARRGDQEQRVRAGLAVSDDGLTPLPATLDELDPHSRPVVVVDHINVDSGQVTLVFFESQDRAVDPTRLGGTLTVEVSTKPLMAMLWVGILIVVAGGLISAGHRWDQARQAQTARHY
jgi:hypothetical protein